MKKKELSAQPDEQAARKPYGRPELRTIELSLEETLAEGCKLGTDPICLANFEAGS